jgi:hypothetical protein
MIDFPMKQSLPVHPHVFGSRGDFYVHTTKQFDGIKFTSLAGEY